MKYVLVGISNSTFWRILEKFVDTIIFIVVLLIRQSISTISLSSSRLPLYLYCETNFTFLSSTDLFAFTKRIGFMLTFTNCLFIELTFNWLICCNSSFIAFVMQTFCVTSILVLGLHLFSNERILRLSWLKIWVNVLLLQTRFFLIFFTRFWYSHNSN